MKNKIKCFISIWLLSLFCFDSMNGQTCTLTAICPGGNWNNPATWSASGGCTVTSPGDNVVCVIPACAVVTVDINSPTYNNMQVHIYGQLEFGNGQKLNLSANGYVYVAPSASLTGGTPGSKINIGGSTVWNGPGPTEGEIFYGPLPLPIDLVSFTANAQSDHVLLNWETMNEKNSSHYEVERSIDAVQFLSIFHIETKAISGNSNEKLIYSATDNNPVNDNGYYRLKQVDKDGTFSYSKIISVNFHRGNSIKFTVYPNPNKGEFTADVSGIENNHEVTLLLHDSQGKLVYKNNFFMQDQASSKFNIHPEIKLANGIYTCTLLVEEIAYPVKVIVN